MFFDAPRSSPRPRSFRLQSALRHGALVIALAIGLAAASGVILSSQLGRAEGRALHVVAQNVSRTLAEDLESRLRQVEVLAADQELWRAGLDTRAVRGTLARLHASTPHSAWVGVASDRGTVLAATGGTLEGASVAARPWFQAGLKGMHVGDVHGALLLAKLLPASASGEPLRFVDFAAPIVVDGRVAGVLGSHGSWEWADGVVSMMAPDTASESRLDIFIFDRAGRLIYSPRGRRSDALSTQRLPVVSVATDTGAPAPEVAAVVRWADGADCLTAASRMKPARAVSDLGWTVVVREPTEVAFAAGRRALWIALLAGAVVAALASALAWTVAGRLSRPLSRIARAARDVERGEPGAEIPIDRGTTELAHLSEALAGMTHKLLAGQLELESRVRARTAELDAANRRLEQLARHDPLTGLPNRRAFDERMDIALAAARRSGLPVSVLMVDADHFKRVNDRFGHEAGDEVLKWLAALLKARLRESDFVARLGGEEFAVCLPDTDATGAMKVAQELVRRIGAEPVADVGRVTVSVGVATARGSIAARDVLLREADQALYVAKNAGRDRASLFNSLAEAALAYRG